VGRLCWYNSSDDCSEEATVLETYQGILHDDRIEWTGDAPRPLGNGNGIRVHVTLLDPVPVSTAEQGRRMAEALERLAALGAVSSIPDPAAWQRETREDRALPGRDD
jgi:hypothetical protein